MGAENLKALEEIKALGHQVDLAGDLAALEPIRQRLEQVAGNHPGDPEIQKAVEATRRLLLDRATRLTLAPPRVPIEPPTMVTAPTTIPDGLVVPPPLPPATKVRPPSPWGRALGTGVVVGLALSVVLIVVLVNIARKRNLNFANLTESDVAVQIATTPPGASIRVNGEVKCTSDCKFNLPPGVYQITAFLEGYEPAASGVNLVLGRPETLNLTLEARPQTVRILSDLAQGKVVFDQQPAVDLQDGEYVFEKVTPGLHSVSVTGPNVETSFNIDLAPAKMPAVSGSVNTKNALAMLVSSFAGHARVMTSSGPWQLAVNGQAEESVGPAGVDLKNFQPGSDEIAISLGKDLRSFKEDFGPGPTLTAFLRTDRNIGMLIVSTGENDARVFLNGKEYLRRTQGGQLRIPTIGTIDVRVMKSGFENAPAQKAEVKKGGEVRLEFKLQPTPQLATLRIEGATPGAEVVIDQRSLGVVADNGSFQNAGVLPGNHVISLRRDKYVPKQFSRTFVAGQTITVVGTDVALVAERPPAPPPPPPAPKPEPVAPKPPPPQISSMDGFESQAGWTPQDNGVWRRRGGGFLLYKPPSAGIYTFAIYLVRGGTLFRGGRVRWVTDYVDSKNYVLSELDDNNLTVRDVVNGKSSDHGKYKHNVDSKDKAWAIQIEISPDTLVQKIQKDKEWVTLDTWNKPDHKFADGKFGFLVQGNDEIGVSDFKFTPAR